MTENDALSRPSQAANVSRRSPWQGSGRAHLYIHLPRPGRCSWLLSLRATTTSTSPFPNRPSAQARSWARMRPMRGAMRLPMRDPMLQAKQPRRLTQALRTRAPTSRPRRWMRWNRTMPATWTRHQTARRMPLPTLLRRRASHSGSNVWRALRRAGSARSRFSRVGRGLLPRASRLLEAMHSNRLLLQVTFRRPGAHRAHARPPRGLAGPGSSRTAISNARVLAPNAPMSPRAFARKSI